MSKICIHFVSVLVGLSCLLVGITSGQQLTDKLQESGLRSLPTLRNLHRKCADPNITGQLFCVADPPDCEKSKDYSCELIATISKFDLSCIKSNLHNPYIRTMCSKRFSTYLITLLRLLSPDTTKRSCEREFFNNRKKCSSREFVALAFSDKADPTVNDDDLFYVCAADEPHITTWTKKGDAQVGKWVRDDDEYENPYQKAIFNESGVGIYWEDLEDLKSRTELVCQFVISVDDIDMQYQLNGSAANASNLLRNQLFSNVTGFIKMVQGVVERKKEDSDSVIERVNLDGIDSPPPPGGPTPIDNGYKVAAFDKIVNLSALERGDSYLFSSHSRENIHNDTQLHTLYWDPVFDLCQDNSAVCYTLDRDPGCFSEDKEACDLLVAIQYMDDYRTLKVSMMVENWQWGGISFSDDRFMADDIGFYCQHYADTTTLRVLLNLKHSGEEGNDTKLADLIYNATNIAQKSDQKRLCIFYIPTVFNISESPFRPDTFIDYDLINKDYYVLMALGNNQNDAVAVHHKKSIVSNKFSREQYIDEVGGENRSTFPNFFSVLITTIYAMCHINLRI